MSDAGTLGLASGIFVAGNAQGPNPNPFADPSPWGAVLVGGLDMGFILSIDGAERPEDWSFQKGTGNSGATSVWKGTKLAEAIKVKVAALNFTAFEGLYILAQVLRPKIGVKPPSLPVVSPVINFNGITNVAEALIGQPTWVEDKAYWTLEVTLAQYNPDKPANVGPADPSKPGSTPDPNADVKAELQKTLDQAAKEG